MLLSMMPRVKRVPNLYSIKYCRRIVKNNSFLELESTHLECIHL